jgi:adenosine deaminase
MITKGIEILEQGVQLNDIAEVFPLFRTAYALTSTTEGLKRATADVLKKFLSSEYGPQCSYLELRTTPRSNGARTREDYLRTVLNEVEQYRPDQAALIVSIDRRMALTDATECVELAITLRDEGRRVVGVDLCGDVDCGDIDTLIPALVQAKDAGLPLTLHIAETTRISSETPKLLALDPARLGHATFLTDEERKIVQERKIPLEICLSSNLICKTVEQLEDHHVLFWLEQDHPVIICTDDILPFRTSLNEEYALLLAQPPLGLGLSEERIRRIADEGFRNRFKIQSK